MVKELIRVLINDCGYTKIITVIAATIGAACITGATTMNVIPDKPKTLEEKEND